MTITYRPDVLAQLEDTQPQWFDMAQPSEPEPDTSGLSWEFCPTCQHQPCVAGGKEYCHFSPRFITAITQADQITNTLASVDQLAMNVALRMAVGRLVTLANEPDGVGDYALNHGLGAINYYLRTRTPEVPS